MNSRVLPFVVARYSTMVFGLVGLLLVGAFIPGSEARSVVMAVLTTLLPLAALHGLGRDPKRQRRASGLALVFVATLWSAHTLKTDPSRLAASATAFILMTYLALAILREVFRAERITADTLYGAVGVYFLVGLAFSSVYQIVEIRNPASFQGVIIEDSPIENFVYFSFVTLATLGYGDIAPVSRPARAVAILEAVVGVVYTNILLARLVALYFSTPGPSGGPARSDRTGEQP